MDATPTSRLKSSARCPWLKGRMLLVAWRASPVASAALINTLLGGLWWTVALRTTSPADVGVFVSISAAGTLLAEVDNLGTGYMLIRYLPGAGRRARHLTMACLLVISVMAFCTSFAFMPAAAALDARNHLPRGLQASWYLLVATLGAGWYSLTDNLLLAYGFAGGLLARAVASSCLRIGLLAGLLLIGRPSWQSLVLCYAAPPLLTSCAVLARCCGSAGPKSAIGIPRPRTLVAYALLTYLGNIFTAATINLLPTIVLARLGPLDSARFGAVWLVANLVMIVPTAISLTGFAEAARGGQRSLEAVVVGAGLVLAVGLPAVAVISLLAPKVLPFLGETYTALGKAVILPLMLGVLLLGLASQVYSQARLSLQGMRVVVVGQGLFAAIVLGLASAMPVARGLPGIAHAWLLGTACAALWAYLYGLRYIRVRTSEVQGIGSDNSVRRDT